MYPPKTGAETRAIYVADENNEIRSPRFLGKSSAIEASATGTKMAVAKPW